MQPYAFNSTSMQAPICSEFTIAAIAFIDMHDFTEITHAFPDKEVVYAMHRCFSLFEMLCPYYHAKLIKNNADECLIVIIDDTLSPYQMANYGFQLCLRCFNVFEQLCRDYHTQGKLRCGLTMGPVIAGYIGLVPRYFDVWGKTVTLASRLEALAQPQSILMNEQFAHTLRPYEQFTQSILGLKGFAKQPFYSFKVPEHDSSRNPPHTGHIQH